LDRKGEQILNFVLRIRRGALPYWKKKKRNKKSQSNKPVGEKLPKKKKGGKKVGEKDI